MADRGDSQANLAARAGISQRAVGDILTYGTSHFKNPTMKVISAVAKAFEMPPWLLMLPGLPLELAKSQRLARLVENYRDAPEEGRATVDRIAESEVRYAVGVTKAKEKTGTG